MFEISITEDDVAKVVGDFMTTILPPAVDISRGQANRVPQPVAKDFIIITSGTRQSLSTATHYNENPAPGVADGEINVWRSMLLVLQIDIYGPASAENAQIITNLFRDEYACAFMAGSGVQPLFCDDARQMPLVDGEFQYEQRWTIEMSLQINPDVVTPMQFADIVTATPFEADQ